MIFWARRGCFAQTLCQLGEIEAARAEYFAVIARSSAGMGEGDARSAIFYWIFHCFATAFSQFYGWFATDLDLYC